MTKDYSKLTDEIVAGNYNESKLHSEIIQLKSDVTPFATEPA